MAVDTIESVTYKDIRELPSCLIVCRPKDNSITSHAEIRAAYEKEAQQVIDFIRLIFCKNTISKMYELLDRNPSWRE